MENNGGSGLIQKGVMNKEMLMGMQVVSTVLATTMLREFRAMEHKELVKKCTSAPLQDLFNEYIEVSEKYTEEEQDEIIAAVTKAFTSEEGQRNLQLVRAKYGDRFTNLKDIVFS